MIASFHLASQATYRSSFSPVDISIASGTWFWFRLSWVLPGNSSINQ